MKAKILFISLMSLALLIMVGCEAPTDPDQSTDYSMAKKAVYPANAGVGDDGDYTLWADYDQVAGVVSFSETSVTITTNDDYDIRGVHIYTWTDEEDIPNSRPAPGHADYSLPSIHESSVTLNIANDSFDYITVHVSLENGVRAYAGGDRYPYGFPEVRGQWWGYIDGEYEVWQ